MLDSIRKHIEKPDYTNIISVFKFKSAIEFDKTSNENFNKINRLQIVDDVELQDVTEYYSKKETPKHFKSAEELISDLDSE